MRCHEVVSDGAAIDPAGVFEQHRTLLVGVAYRMLGSVSDAEDVVQETWLRWPPPTAPECATPGPT